MESRQETAVLLVISTHLFCQAGDEVFELRDFIRGEYRIRDFLISIYPSISLLLLSLTI
ncbi:hypothetical protein Pmani_003622 [Petrolisthes manimaculis]|uniref:Uncharacterized protein n=1 Tax=Petrolisthes manimaculis TaxID=1843537 RepID=A0AAE1QFM8_9EUCA|nr:hypothetical protein Pmani_003622 [Petrolisthes manimaculis]